MKIHTILLGELLCLVGVNASRLKEKYDPDSLSDVQNQNDVLRMLHQQLYNMHRTSQINYGYDYRFLPNRPYNYLERRDYDRNQQEQLREIVKLLEEILDFVKRIPPPPPAPQLIYIPYPVFYPVLQYAPCSDNKTIKHETPNLVNRFPDDEDPVQNWGYIDKDDADDVNDGARPISFDPIKPIRPMKVPPPKMKPGSSQGDNQQSIYQTSEKFPDSKIPMFRTPSMCIAALPSFFKTPHSGFTRFVVIKLIRFYALGSSCGYMNIF